MVMNRTNIFIEKAKKIHGDKYDYFKVDYINNREKVCIICSKHGEFWQSPKSHLTGCGCPKCGRETSAEKTNGRASFLEKAEKVHGKKYDYTKVEYKNAYSLVCIGCPEHGEFWQIPHDHIRGHGCPQCRKKQDYSIERKQDQSDFREKAEKVHGKRYDYSKVQYVNYKTDVCISCPEHGEFWQSPANHLKGCGCPKCATEYSQSLFTLGKEGFIRRAKEVHGEKYDYSKVDYSNNREKVCIVCPKHGEFWQEASSHLMGKGCPKCGAILSKKEEDIWKFCCEIVGKENVIRNDRTVLEGREIDIFIPSKSIGIEYNGLRWHSDMFKEEKEYHKEKTEAASRKGIALIQIFEDEYIDKKETVLSMIERALSPESLKKVDGSEGFIKEIGIEEAKIFLKENSIEDYKPSSIRMGLFQKEGLAGVMAFRRLRGKSWKIGNFSVQRGVSFDGIGEAFLKAFFNSNEAETMIVSIDRRLVTKDEENEIIRNGFWLNVFSKPNFKYFNYHEGIRRYSAAEIKGREKEFSKVYDCGQIEYKLVKQ